MMSEYATADNEKKAQLIDFTKDYIDFAGGNFKSW